MGSPLPFASRLKSAGTTLVIARASYDIWWLYASATTRPLFLAGMDEYSEFFRFDEEGHFRLAVVGVWTLFDGRRDTVTLPALMDDCAAMGLDVGLIKRRLDQLTPALRKIRVLRHKLFAHRNHSISYEDVYKEAQIAGDDLRGLLDESLAIVNAMAGMRGLSHTQFNEFVAGDTASVLRKIQPS